MASVIPSSQESSNAFYLSRPQHPMKLSYLSLPAEIRNQIMDLAFVADHIYLDWRYRPRKFDGVRSGVHLLATCRQVYQEGIEVYNSKQVLHLPPEPIQAIEKSLETIPDNHIRSINHVCITWGPWDGLLGSPTDGSVGFRHAIDLAGAQRDAEIFVKSVESSHLYLDDIYKHFYPIARRKIHYAFRRFPNLEKLSVDNMTKQLDLVRRDPQSTMEPSQYFDIDPLDSAGNLPWGYDQRDGEDNQHLA